MAGGLLLLLPGARLRPVEGAQAGRTGTVEGGRAAPRRSWGAGGGRLPYSCHLLLGGSARCSTAAVAAGGGVGGRGYAGVKREAGVPGGHLGVARDEAVDRWALRRVLEQLLGQGK